jgi:hypothetical protein
MAKAYWVTCYRSISDPEKLAAYAKLAAQPSLPSAGAISRAVPPSPPTKRA